MGRNKIRELRIVGRKEGAGGATIDIIHFLARQVDFRKKHEDFSSEDTLKKALQEGAPAPGIVPGTIPENPATAGIAAGMKDPVCALETLVQDITFHIATFKKFGNAAFKDKQFTKAENCYQSAVDHALLRCYALLALEGPSQGSNPMGWMKVIGRAKIEVVKHIQLMRGVVGGSCLSSKNSNKESRKEGTGVVDKDNTSSSGEKPYPTSDEQKDLLKKAELEELGHIDAEVETAAELITNAVFDLSQEKKFNRDLAILYSNLGFSQTKKTVEDKKNAILNQETATMLDPTYPKAWYRSAEALFESGYKENALKAIAKAGELDKGAAVKALREKIEAMK